MVYKLCPCQLNCKGKRKDAVNIVFENEILTSNELKQKLKDKGFGGYVIQKSLELLKDNKCQYIDVLKQENDKHVRFRKHGRIFYRINCPEVRKMMYIRKCLTNLQHRLLSNFTRYNRRVYYFSLYDLKKIMPYQGNAVEYSLQKLFSLNLIEQLTIGKTNFFVLPRHLGRLIQENEVILENDKLEFKTIKAVHEIIMNVYPPNLINSYRGAIRPKSSEILSLTGGMTFDIFYKFKTNIWKKEFFAIDVYIRLPVTGYVVNSFLNKIKWAVRRRKDNPVRILRNKTYGMIVFKIATPKAIQIANRKGIRLVRLSDLKLDLEKNKDYPD